jgi:hypothetical protein
LSALSDELDQGRLAAGAVGIPKGAPLQFAVSRLVSLRGPAETHHHRTRSNDRGI